jgi:hypothetical protein
MTHDEIQAIKQELITELDDRYVKQSVCNDVQSNLSDTLSKQRTKLEIASHDLSAIKKGIWLVASTSIGLLVATIFDFIKG